MDLETDKVMQDVIADQFASRTILTIAHRINTIIENDKVVCLEHGRLQRMDSPAAMLRDPESMFAKLVAETGEQSARICARGRRSATPRASRGCRFAGWGARIGLRRREARRTWRRRWASDDDDDGFGMNHLK